ncbi:ABC transporter permease subunit [Georgenia wutianyii]|uniref:ABC transporter permease subunit n=1 Tax=Georgenia wutianyii TaxID=2585135 RepID=A0ABX5VTM9_9MICO|nr:ABC transporter permease subunit [Georgenia wutianyii]
MGAAAHPAVEHQQGRPGGPRGTRRRAPGGRPVTTVTRARRADSRTRAVALPAAVVLGLLALAQVLSVTDVLPRRYAPPPTEVLAALGRLLAGPALWADIGATLVGWAVSLAIAVLVGTAVGLLLGSVRPVRWLLTPVVEFLRPIPSIALIPLVVLTLGRGREGEVFLAAYAAVWQMLVAAIYATSAVDPVARDTARAFGFSRLHTIRWVTLPAMVPGLVTGVRIASATALIITVTSEILLGVPGLGEGLNLARNAGDLTRMYAYVVVIGVVGLGINTAFTALTRRFLTWRGR